MADDQEGELRDEFQGLKESAQVKYDENLGDRYVDSDVNVLETSAIPINIQKILTLLHNDYVDTEQFENDEFVLTARSKTYNPAKMTPLQKSVVLSLKPKHQMKDQAVQTVLGKLSKTIRFKDSDMDNNLHQITQGLLPMAKRENPGYNLLIHKICSENEPKHFSLYKALTNPSEREIPNYFFGIDSDVMEFVDISYPAFSVQHLVRLDKISLEAKIQNKIQLDIEKLKKLYCDLGYEELESRPIDLTSDSNKELYVLGKHHFFSTSPRIAEIGRDYLGIRPRRAEQVHTVTFNMLKEAKQDPVYLKRKKDENQQYLDHIHRISRMNIPSLKNLR